MQNEMTKFQFEMTKARIILYLPVHCALVTRQRDPCNVINDNKNKHKSLTIMVNSGQWKMNAMALKFECI